MVTFARYNKSVGFLRKIDPDWADLVARVGPCRHDPKAAREPYEALVRAIGYQQLTAKAGDAMIGRLKALHPDVAFPTPENILRSDFDALRACGFSAAKIATIKAIADGALSGMVPTRGNAVEMEDEELVERITKIKGNREMDRRNAAHVLAGAHGYPACRRFRRARRLPQAQEPGRTSETQQAPRDRQGVGAAPHRCVVVSLAHPARSRRGFETAGKIEASRTGASMTPDE